MLLCAATPRLAAAQAAPVPAPAEERPIKRLINSTMETLDRAHAPHLDLRRDPLGVRRTRTSTGTAWLPTEGPTNAIIFPVRRWGLMVRGNIFVGYGQSSGPRGTRALANTSTLMLAALGAVGPGELVLRSVFSLERITRSAGSPAPRWRPYRSAYDRDPPHRWFHEVAAEFTWPLHDQVAIKTYAALPGAPALGPPDYAFRPSSYFDPVAPLTRGMLEDTRTSPGVLTLGLSGRRVKLEGSWFAAPTIRLPAHGLAAHRPDSGAVRAAFAPSPRWTLSLSYGRVQVPLQRDAQHRTIVSSMWNRRTLHALWSVGLVAGVGISTRTPTERAALLEAAWQRHENHTVFTRLQVLEGAGPPLEPTAPGQLAAASLGGLSLGYVYSFGGLGALAPGIGVRGEGNVLSRAGRGPFEKPWAGGVVAFVQLRQKALPER